MEKRLSASRASAIAAKGLYADGGSLYLQAVIRKGKLYKSWVFKFRSPETNKLREMGLGSANIISLAEARTARDAARSLLRAGMDPIEEKGRVAVRQAELARLEAARSLSFDDAAAAYFDSHKAAWKDRHRLQFVNSLVNHASPVFGKMSIADVNTGMVIKCLERNNFWNTKPETASRVRARIERVIDWAEARGFRPEGANPASWRKLSMLLPSKRKLKTVKHFAAMPYAELPAFMKTLESVETMSALALGFVILTGSRASEATGTRWDEIDFNSKLWTIPASRMKMKCEHRVPLSEPTLHILQRLQEARVNSFVFSGRGGSLKPDAMQALLHKLGCDVTVHGFRSSFRDWCGEETNFAREVAEAALAHRVGNDVEAAYRGDALSKRRELMNAWGKFLTKK